MDLPENSYKAEQTIQALWKVTKVILDTLDFNQVVQKICDSLLTELGLLNLGYRIMVLSLYQDDLKGLKRISLSQTPEARAATNASTIPFHDIVIPISATQNYCVRSFLEHKPFVTHDWKDILSPPLIPEDARTNQTAAGIKTSMVYPVVLKGQAVGIVIFSMVKEESEVSQSEFELIRGFTDIVGIAVQNAQLFSNLEKTSKRLDDANKRLQQLDKLKDEFVSLASHELRTPMTAIKSYTWMVLNGKAGPLDPKTREYLDIVFSSTERLIHLVNDMLDVSRIESGRVQLKPENFDIYELALQVKNELSARALEKGLTLNVTKTDPLPPVFADKDKTQQVFENLVGNSIKFTNHNGTITINLKPGPENTVQADVSDTGKGIAAEDIPKLFAKFGRLDNTLPSISSEPGTGLGLYICKQYVELNKGKIWVTSELGKGTTFSFTMPQASNNIPPANAN